MEIQLNELSVPPRITVQKKLLATFGVHNEGRITKELRQAREATTGVATGKKRNTTTTTTNSKGKGKEKGVGNRKKTKKPHTNTDDEDEDDEDDDDDDEHGDSAWVEADSAEDDDGDGEEDGDGDGDGDMKEARVRLRQEKTMKKHRDIIAKHEEWLETHAVLVGSKGDGRASKHGPTLDFDRQPPSFQKTWKKVSRVSKDRRSVPMRGLALVDWTTWEWKNISSQSFTRVMRSFAAAAIAESSAIISYRHEMIFCHPEGGAATLRLRVQDAISTHLVPKDRGQVRESRQTTLKDLLGSASQGSKAGKGCVLTEGDLPPPQCLTWADGIYPERPKPGVAEHFVEDELDRLERERALGAQQRAVQKAINAVQDLRVAWHDPTSTARAREKPALDEDVASALRTLVKVSCGALLSASLAHAGSTRRVRAKTLNVNAYRQRVKPTRTLSFDREEAMAPRERLQITIRSDLPSKDHLDDTFVLGVPKMLHLQEIPTKAQSIQHLEDLVRKYAEWLKAHKQKGAETGVGPATFKFVKKEDPVEAEEEDESEEEEEEEDSDADADGSVELPGRSDVNDTTQVCVHPISFQVVARCSLSLSLKTSSIRISERTS